MRTVCLSALLCCVAWPVFGQQGQLVQRLDAAPAGAIWLTQDSLNLSGGLGGAFALTSGYARNPLVVGGAPVITDLATANIGLAVTYSRYRLAFDLASPLYVRGNGTPSLDIASHPDTITDVRIGADARVWGDVGGPIRLGLSAQLFVPSADRTDYMSDGTYRAKFWLKAAGDVSRFSYAASAGYHVRPLLGNELNYGAAAGWRFALGDALTSLVIGPEAFGALGPQAQQMWEALLTGRVDLLSGDGHALRFKLGAGVGQRDLAGAAQWRVVAAVEVVGLATAATGSD